MLGFMKRFISLRLLMWRWRKLNAHNKTTLVRNCNYKVIKVGRETYGQINALTWNNSDEGLEIGNYCSIASNVTFVLAGNHHVSGFTTYPIKSFARELSPDIDAKSKGCIKIEDDVWIGFGATILSGVTIARGSIIAAGSVVTKSFPEYSIIAGNPAVVVKKRLAEEAISFAKQIDFSCLDISRIDDEQVSCFYEAPTRETLSILSKMKNGL
ncbi:CatB-related O-acetyltransferase [Aeromonas veronii]|uniref:CatB-related O-acetyltransferase n=1 Tax=Aeromonas veronii TaxID=654 RepID=UPI00405572A8